MESNSHITLIQAKNGELTCEYSNDEQSLLLHSKYNPTKEAEAFISNHIHELNKYKKVVVYGLGCGHHIKALLRQTEESHQEIEVWEWNLDLYKMIQEIDQLNEVFSHKRVRIFATDNREIILKKLQDYAVKEFYLLIHSPSMKIIPSKFQKFKDIMQDYQINISNILANRDMLNEHFSINRIKAKVNYHTLIDSLNGVSAILVSAGPSLNKSLSYLRENIDKYIIASVGTALTPLIENGIIPDFVLITDPSEKIIEQFYQVDNEILTSIPLFYFGTVHPKVISFYPGKKIMLLQKGMELAEEMAVKNELPLIDTGGSVATALLDWLVKLGAKQICFIGQDLAYTNNETHNPGTHNYRIIKKEEMSFYHKVDNYFGNGKVLTTTNLLLYKNWFEKYIQKHKGIKFVNATEGGAYIKGAEHISFEQFIKRLNSTNVRYKRNQFKQLIEQL
ncbi:motility associated factor glycosyltransferase family protein [Tepidibacillus fermentans]|uniref:Uncharacterized protein DUF115 n=1 Tax=Tepidibacillus fermentans TaxID=1281767 RepID=A0A4R3KKN8_9BACI|nr:6-hydroxymethylpterin diphosphokinase MptE-like protein [Tepidibacillus fermentans]TCS83313.1 uncharacterized protein DUF115 [Tepidibacillus fermentans]